jgi:hypothetical protein
VRRDAGLSRKREQFEWIIQFWVFFRVIQSGIIAVDVGQLRSYVAWWHAVSARGQVKSI